MMPETITLDEFNSLLGLVLRNLRISGITEVAATPLKQVAAQCGFSERTLLNECRAGRIEHIHFGGARAMTPTQIHRFLLNYSRGGELAKTLNQDKPAPRNDMAVARAASSKAASRRTKRAA